MKNNSKIKIDALALCRNIFCTNSVKVAMTIGAKQFCVLGPRCDSMTEVKPIPLAHVNPKAVSIISSLGTNVLPVLPIIGAKMAPDSTLLLEYDGEEYSYRQIEALLSGHQFRIYEHVTSPEMYRTFLADTPPDLIKDTLQNNCFVLAVKKSACR